MMAGAAESDPAPDDVDAGKSSDSDEPDDSNATPRPALDDGSTAGISQSFADEDSEDDESQITDDASHSDVDDDESEGSMVVSNGMSAGVSYAPKQEPRTSEPSTASLKQLPEPAPYEVAPYISREDIKLQAGDFIRYLKEDGVIYQGYIKHGTPVENGFNPYPDQEEDLVTKLVFDDGKHVAPQSVQRESRITVVVAQNQTAQGRNVEVVSPDEVIAVSPENAYDWYRFTEAWDREEDELTLDADDL